MVKHGDSSDVGTSKKRHRSRSPAFGRHRRSPTPTFRGRRRSRSQSKNSYDRKTLDDHRNKKRSRSSSSESDRAERKREKNKREMRQRMADNYQKAQMTNNAKLKSYNTPVDPSKLVEEVEKRKLLFSKKEEPADAPASSTSLWNQTKFTDDSDGTVTAKFKRLMGIKEAEATVSSDKNTGESSDVELRKQKEYFAGLEQQYEVARATTHIKRGLGLGFSTKYNSGNS